MGKDLELDIATGHSRKTRTWSNKKITWGALVDKLSKSQITGETSAEYRKASRSDKGQIKDVGGYVGGYLNKGKRSPGAVLHRSLLSLDIDFATAEFWEDFKMFLGCESVLHSTHSHTKEAPRYRLIIPFSRPVSAEEYEPIARKVAELSGLDNFDKTTFEVSRLMYWPSTPSDVEYEFKHHTGEVLAPDEILKLYTDWTDASAWAFNTVEAEDLKKQVGKQEDPLEKTGLIGAFCRAYSIDDAISELLPDVYTHAIDGRYTYINGSTASGVVTYDNKFAFSHHGTDPAGGQLCNAYDLVRIHKFGHLDTTPNSKISAKKMEALIIEDDNVKEVIARERMAEALEDFKDMDADMDVEAKLNEIDFNWIKKLELNGKGEYLSNAQNLNVIFENDQELKQKFKQNRFDGRPYLMASTLWRSIKRPEPMRNVDYSGIRNYIEVAYNITGHMKIEDALNLALEKYSFNPITEYLKGLKWDRTPRIDALLVDYFGAPPSEYTSEAIRKPLVAAVARAFNPGCKFDLVLTLVGPQGTKKSSFFNRLGGPWFSDTFITVEGKGALEQIQGAWIIEMAELSGLRKSEVESIKHFISKQEDVFRPAYARVSETFPRKCVFFGTTNNTHFLTDATGNRRFLPVQVVPENIKKDVFKDLDKKEVDQIWAEAVHLFAKNEPLVLSENAGETAVKAQEEHGENDERQGLIESFLDLEIPENWNSMNPDARSDYFLGLSEHNEAKIKRSTISVAEVWVECLGKHKSEMNKSRTRELNNILRQLKGWRLGKGLKTIEPYGRQRFYERV